MSLNLYISNSLEALAQKLSKNIAKNNSNVFLREKIITQTSGMNRWLCLQIAQNNSVFAGFDFLKPNALVDDVYRLCGGEIPDFYSTTNYKWVLYSLLAEKEFVNRFKEVSGYYLKDDIKRLQLATKIADLFDQYLIYRPDMIEAWNNGEKANIKKLHYHEAWQQWLWTNAKAYSKENIPDKTQHKKHIINTIKNPAFRKILSDKYKRISLYGLSILTPFHLEIIYYLSEFLPIDFYLLNPSPKQYWYDDKSKKAIAYWEEKTGQDAESNYIQTGNSLLSNLGKIGKETYSMLYASDDFINAIDDNSSLEPIAHSMLSKIQNDIYNNYTEKERNTLTKEDLSDESIQIASCYTPAREVEALYNYLLHLKEHNEKDLKPGEIVVLLTDVNKYAPFIKAVFDTAEYTIPYTIADMSYQGDDNIVNLLSIILDIQKENFSSERVIQLLEFTYVRKKFGISNLKLIREVIREANIRFGIEGREEDDTQYVSWKHGLERILLGYAIKGGEEYHRDNDSIFPLDIVEGEDAREMLRLKAFVDSLSESVQKRERARSLSDWKDYIHEEILEKLLFIDDDNINEYSYISGRLSTLDDASQYMKENVSFDVLKKSFIASLFSDSRSGGYITGALTFCSMIPMRSIPFKVVAILGMNNDIFPRKENKESFNLMDEEYRYGDRNIKENDKYLFLETISSAQKHLYISYIGKDPKDNSPVPPSILVDELIDTIENGATDISAKTCRDTIITQHPLHSFSKKYYEGDKKLYTYLGDTVNEENKVTSGELRSSNPFDTIELRNLIGFYKNPFKWYYNNSLKIWYDNTNELVPETEIFDLNKLAEWGIKSTFLKTDSEDIYVLKDKGVKTGSLPLKNMAEVSLQNINEDIKDLKTSFEEEINKEEERIEAVCFEIDNKVLNGEIGSIYGDKHVFPSVSSKDAKYLLTAWIEHLALIAGGKGMDSCFISKDGAKRWFMKELCSKDKAIEILGKLIDYYIKGHENILTFFPEPAHIFAEKGKIKSVLKSFNENAGYGNSEYYDEYLHHFYDEETFEDNFKENEDEFIELSELLFKYT